MGNFKNIYFLLEKDYVEWKKSESFTYHSPQREVTTVNRWVCIFPYFFLRRILFCFIEIGSTMCFVLQFIFNVNNRPERFIHAINIYLPLKENWCWESKKLEILERIFLDWINLALWKTCYVIFLLIILS